MSLDVLALILLPVFFILVWLGSRALDVAVGKPLAQGITLMVLALVVGQAAFSVLIAIA
ncbi:hypothetical protein KLP28_12815 [Nocardioidaceae bacterium]|nr:hypothetical protein KLP28_12815 [Nocardioidaceae bacterium]